MVRVTRVHLLSESLKSTQDLRCGRTLLARLSCGQRKQGKLCRKEPGDMLDLNKLDSRIVRQSLLMV
jgi:hypothetical protein